MCLRASLRKIDTGADRKLSNFATLPAQVRKVSLPVQGSLRIHFVVFSSCSVAVLVHLPGLFAIVSIIILGGLGCLSLLHILVSLLGLVFPAAPVSLDFLGVNIAVANLGEFSAYGE